MCIKGRQTAGFTLIELIIFIVVVSVGLTGVLASLNISVKNSADPLRPKQALAIAEGLLEEILLKSYCDPDAVGTDLTRTPPICGTNGTEARSLYDAIEDYDTVTTGGGTDVTTNAVGGAWTANYTPTVTVTVTNTTLGPAAIPALQIVVSVSYDGTQVVSLTGYRTNF